jgi:tRNA (guanine37-N1)-methyltransferase
MVYKVKPIYKAVQVIKGDSGKQSKVILFTPRGEKLTQKKVTELSKADQVIMICGRYEGVDERVAQYIADEEISIGEYDLLGGEVPAMVLIEAVSRLVPGVIGNHQILKQRVTDKGAFVEYEQYTRPSVFQTEEGEEWKVPEVLLSGDHKKIEKWRKNHSKRIGETG